MAEHIVAHDGLAFRCRVDGPEGAPWIVCSNSIVNNLTVWDHQVAAFADRYRLLRYDQRGHGETSVPPGPATIEQLAEDAAALMAHFGIRDSIFLGCSMGAATGFCLAASRPDLVSRLIGSDGQAGTIPGGTEAWQGRIDFCLARGMTAYADVTIPKWFSPRSHAEANPAIPPVRAMIETTPLAGFVACARALQWYDFHPGLPTTMQPTLLLAGHDDGTFPERMRELATRMPNAGFVEIADAGHLPCIERPAAFNAALEAFLA